MLIDCDTCSAQGLHCHDCVISVLLDAPPQHLELDSDEQIAFVSLAEAGLLPPLRLVPPADSNRAGPNRAGPNRADPDRPQRDTRGIA